MAPNETFERGSVIEILRGLGDEDLKKLKLYTNFNIFVTNHFKSAHTHEDIEKLADLFMKEMEEKTKIFLEKNKN